MKRSLSFLVVISLGLLDISCCQAQEALDTDVSQMTRQEWRDHIKASRQRAEIMRRERRGFVPQPPILEEVAEQATKRALEDDSLRPGDIVSTNRGLFRYR